MTSLSIRLPQLSPLPSSPSAKFPSSALAILPLRNQKVQNGRSSSRRSGTPAMAITCNSSPPGKKKPPRRSRDNCGTSEALDLVRTVLRKAGEGKQPLVPVLNHYVRILRTEHCFLIFEELGKQDRWLQCLEVFRWMQKQRWYVADNGIYSKLISVMGKRGQTRTAMWLFSEMRTSGCRPDTSVYNALISAHLRHKDRSKALAKAWHYFQKMKSTERCQPNSVTYNILLRALAQSGDATRTHQLFLELDAINGADSYTFNGVMDAYAKNGMIQEMEAALREMKIRGIRPGGITFNLLIDAYGKKQAFEKMEQVFKSLLKSREKPTLPTFNSMILSYGKARMREKVEWIFGKMLELGYTPSVVTRESLIAAYGLCAEVDSARKVFDGMLESGFKPEASTLNAMLEVYCSNGLVGEAELMMEEAVKGGVLPNASSYRMLYKAFARASRKDLILKLLKRMERDGVVPNKGFFLDALGDLGSSSSPTLSPVVLSSHKE